MSRTCTYCDNEPELGKTVCPSCIENRPQQEILQRLDSIESVLVDILDAIRNLEPSR